MDNSWIFINAIAALIVFIVLSILLSYFIEKLFSIIDPEFEDDDV